MGSLRCPACGAGVRPGAPWCTLCLAVLEDPKPAGPRPGPLRLEPGGPDARRSGAARHRRPPGGSPAAGSPAAGIALLNDEDARWPGSHVPLPLPNGVTPTPTWPCSGCAEQVSLEAPVCPRCGTAFLAPVRSAPLAAGRPRLLRDLLGMSRGARVALAAGAAVVLAATLIGLLSLVGTLA